MNNRQAMEYASKHKNGFEALYELGFEDGKHEAILHQANHDLSIKEAMADAVMLFVSQASMMADDNWTPEQCKMLKWLFGAVIAEKEYAEYAGEQLKEQTNE